MPDEQICGFIELTKKTPPIEGETQDATFKKYKAIEVLNFSLSCGAQSDVSDEAKKDMLKDLFGMEKPAAGQSGGAGGTAKPPAPKTSSKGSKPEEKTFEISKYLDCASPALFVSYCQALQRPIDKDAKIDRAKLTLMKHGVYGQKAQHIKYLIIYFESLYVRSYSLEAEFPYPSEKVTFSFQKCMLRYTPQTWTGEATTLVQGGWDFEVGLNGKVGGMWAPDYSDPV